MHHVLARTMFWAAGDRVLKLLPSTPCSLSSVVAFGSPVPSPLSDVSIVCKKRGGWGVRFASGLRPPNQTVIKP